MPILADAHISSLGFLWHNAIGLHFNSLRRRRNLTPFSRDLNTPFILTVIYVDSGQLIPVFWFLATWGYCGRKFYLQWSNSRPKRALIAECTFFDSCNDIQLNTDKNSWYKILNCILHNNRSLRSSRLYPDPGFWSRVLSRDAVLSGYHVPAGVSITKSMG